MTKALYWIRKSEGSDDDVGLNQQRELLKELAHEYADEVEKLDLGVFTGFSRSSADDLPLKEEFIDDHPDVQKVLDRIRDGEFDHLVAWDDTRIARDEFYSVIEYTCRNAGCEIVFYEELPDDPMVNDVRRIVEYYVKLNEMKKAQKAKIRMQEQGRPDGRPPYGLRYSADKTELVPDEDEWDEVVRILQLADEGESQRGIARQVEPSRSTVRRVLGNCKDYEEFLLETE